MKTRVLIVSSCFGTYGGIEAFVLAVAQSISNKSEFDVRLVWKATRGFEMTRALEQRSDESGVKWRIVNRAGLDLMEMILWADLVHAQNSPADVVLLSKLFHKPILLTVHNRRIEPNSWRSILTKYTAKLAQERWYNSNFVWNTWEPDKKQLGSRRIPTVSHLPSGWVSPEKRSGFVFAARWIQNKGIELLVDAYAEARLSPEDWPLRLIGDGPLRNKVEQKIRDQKIRGIEILGFVSEERKAELIRNAKWMVVPPHTQEDLGLTAIEARHVGVPCIASRDGGLPEAAGKEALYFEPGNVKQLIDCLRQAASMSELDYSNKSQETARELNHFLVPMEFYAEAYKRHSLRDVS